MAITGTETKPPFKNTHTKVPRSIVIHLLPDIYSPDISMFHKENMVGINIDNIGVMSECTAVTIVSAFSVL